VEDLQYKGHELVVDAILSQYNWIDRIMTRLSPPLDEELSHSNNLPVTIVDIGCGTGLLGELLRRRIEQGISQSCSLNASGNGTSSFDNSSKLQIIGVDLSERMVELSRSRSITLNNHSSTTTFVYDQVIQADGAQFLRSLDVSTVEVITASDVFIYIGALEEIFEECARVLSFGGLLSFTVELSKEENFQGVKLLKSGRFGHSKKHVQQVAKKYGFQMLQWKEAVLRKQGGSDVPGAVVVLAAP
jgi:predicted TPR repeat methyltransferase